MYWQDVTLVDSKAPMLICLSGEVELDFAEASFLPIFVKLKFSLAKFCLRKTLFYPSLPIKF
jgi:hypothetical protein